MVLFKKCKKREKIQAEIQFISLFITLFFLNLKESQEKRLPVNELCVCVRGCLCVCKDTVVIFFCFQLMFKLFSLRVFAAMSVSSTSFLRLCCLDACSPGMDKGANSGIGTLQGIQLCVCMCRCVFVWPHSWCVCAATERASRRPDGVFSHTLGRFIHPSLR